MKILVVHASVGAGHTSAAKAIYAYLKQRKPDCDIRLIDVLQYSEGIFRNCFVLGYYFLIKYCLPVWELGFVLTANKFLRLLTGPAGSILNRLNTREFRLLLMRDEPDIIISTHFLPSEIASGLKKSQKIKSKLFTVVTDYIVHPLWINPCTDYYLVACGLTGELLAREGIDDNAIKVTGIPVQEKFLKKYDRMSLREKLGIKKDSFTVLVATGSFGIGPIRQITQLLCQDVLVLAVCAGNKRLYGELKEDNLKNVKVFGFVDNMQELMAVSDMIVTKPGGLTISEILNMELIPVFIYPIPGQETGNVSVLEKYGVGSSPKTLTELRNVVLDFKENPEKLRSAKLQISRMKKQDTLGELFDVVCKSGSGLTG